MRLLRFALPLTVAACLPNEQIIPAPVGPLSADQARVYVVRTGVTASGIPAEIHDGDVVVGSLAPDNYLVWDRAPGVAPLTMSTENGVALRVDVTLSPGDTLYVELRQYELIQNRPMTLAVVPPDVGRELVKKARFAPH